MQQQALKVEPLEAVPEKTKFEVGGRRVAVCTVAVLAALCWWWSAHHYEMDIKKAQQ
jgi:hypothetical protein